MTTHHLVLHPGRPRLPSPMTMGIPTASFPRFHSIQHLDLNIIGLDEQLLQSCLLPSQNALVSLDSARRALLVAVLTMTVFLPMLPQNQHAPSLFRMVRLCCFKPHCLLTAVVGNDTYIVPEDSRPEAPPSYASAQADAVPPYWETTVHAPFAPGTIGEMIVDSLPTGSLFSFLWNMLVSISFQFVGFLLTYLLHTTHAARLGSRAGLGVTLIQYGFALRGRLDDPSGSKGDSAGWNRSWSPAPIPSEAGDSPYYGHHHSAPNATMTEEQANTLVADATTEWLSFFLMTVGALDKFSLSKSLQLMSLIGWFILLTSLLGFWRVKRWERGILASQQDHSNVPANTQLSRGAFLSRLEHTFSLRGTSRADLFRRGFGFGPRRNPNSEEQQSVLLARAEEGDVREGDREALETDLMIPVDPNDPQRSRQIAEALANERRLQADLRSAGLL